MSFEPQTLTSKEFVQRAISFISGAIFTDCVITSGGSNACICDGSNELYWNGTSERTDRGEGTRCAIIGAEGFKRALALQAIELFGGGFW